MNQSDAASTRTLSKLDNMSRMDLMLRNGRVNESMREDEQSYILRQACDVENLTNYGMRQENIAK